MTLLTPPGFLQAGTYTALLDRMHLITAVTMRSAAVAQSGRQGFYPDRYPAYANPSGMDVVIGACAGIVENDFATNVGEYRFINPSNLTLTPAASSPTLNRYDILGFQVKDNFYDGSGQNSIIPVIIQGANSAGTPVDPAQPSSFIPVVRAVVNAGVTSPTLQDMRVKTAMTTGVLPVESDAIRTAIGTPSAGMVIARTDGNRLEQASPAGTWLPVSVPVVSTVAALSTLTGYDGEVAVALDQRALYVYNTGAAAWQSIHPRGALYRGVATTSSTAAATSSALRLDNMTLRAGRLYRLSTGGLYMFGTVNGDTFTVQCTLNTGGVATTGSPLIGGAVWETKVVNGGGTAAFGRIDTDFTVASDTALASILLFVVRTTGTGTAQIFGNATNPIIMTVADIGLAPANTGVDL